MEAVIWRAEGISVGCMRGNRVSKEHCIFRLLKFPINKSGRAPTMTVLLAVTAKSLTRSDLPPLIRPFWMCLKSFWR